MSKHFLNHFYSPQVDKRIVRNPPFPSILISTKKFLHSPSQIPDAHDPATDALHATNAQHVSSTPNATNWPIATSPNSPSPNKHDQRANRPERKEHERATGRFRSQYFRKSGRGPQTKRNGKV